MDAVWIDNRISWTLRECNYKLLRGSHWVTHSKDHCNYSKHAVFSVCYVFTSCCLVTDPNNVLCFCTHVLAEWRLARNYLLLFWHFKTLEPNGSWLSLYSFGKDRTENTAPTAFPLLRACLLWPLPNNGRCLQSHYLTTAVVRLLISRSCLATGLHATIS
jgi:hypothetical protein